MGLKFYKGTAAEYNAKKDKISEGGLIVTKENNSSQTGNLYINDNGTHVQLSSNKAFTDITLAGNTLTGVALDGSSKAVTLPSMTVDSTFSTTSTNAVQNKIVTAKINTMEGNIGTNATNIITNTNNIAQNTSDIAQHTADIAQNLAAIAIASDNISSLNAIVESEKGKLSTAQTDIGNLQKAVGALESADAAFAKEHETISGRIDDNAGAISRHEQALDTLSSDFSELGTDLAEAEQRLQANINTNAGFISENTQALSVATGNIATLQSQMSTAQGTIGQHASMLQGIEAGAEVNAIETISVNGIAQQISDTRNVNITVPTGSLANLNTVAEDHLEANLKAKINGKVDTSTYNTKVAALENADSAMQANISKLQTAVGNSTSIAQDITNAVNKAKQELTSDIATAKSESNAYADSVKTSLVNNEIKSINSTLDTHDGRISTVETFFAAAESSAEFVQTLKEIQTYIDEDADAAQQMIGRIGANETAISGLQNSVSSINGVNNSQDSRLDALEAGQWDKIDKITINGDEVPLSDKTATISLGALAFSDKVSTALLNSDVSTAINNKVTIDTYNSKMETLDEKDAKFTTDISNIQKSLETKASTSSVSDLSTQVGTISSTVNGLNTTVNSLQGTVGGHTSSIAGLQGELSTLSSTVTGQGTTLDTVVNNYITKADKAALEGSISGNTIRIKDLEDTRIRGVRIDTSAKKLYVTPASGDNEVPYDIPDTTYTAATSSKDGLMSKLDKTKLDGLPQITFCTKAQYESYGSGVNSDGIIYFIKG